MRRIVLFFAWPLLFLTSAIAVGQTVIHFPQPGQLTNSYQSSTISFAYPSNWQTVKAPDTRAATNSVGVAAPNAVVQTQRGPYILCGAWFTFFPSPENTPIPVLETLNQQVVDSAIKADSVYGPTRLVPTSRQYITVAGHRGIVETLTMAYENIPERDWLATIPVEKGALIVSLAAPEPEWETFEPTFRAMLASVGFPLESHAVRWSPIIESSSVDTNEIFPAEILALATFPVPKVPATYLGDPKAVLGVKVVSPTPNTPLRVSIKVDGLAEQTAFEITLPDANREYEIWPPNRFDMRALAGMREPFPTTAVFSVFVNGTSAGEQTRTIRVRSVNDVPFLRRLRDGRTQDLSPLFAAFVDENHPWIDGVLSEALRWQAIRQFSGYQGPPQEVYHQVFAIWNVLQRRQVRYSSITRPSGESETVFSQHVRFLDETIRTSEANCVDGTVLFASIIYKLEMCPVLVLKPGHMFLGFHLDEQSCGQPGNLAFLETTLIGNPGLGVLQRGWKFLDPDNSYLGSESYSQFTQALDEGTREFQSLATSPQSRGQIIEIARARKTGISPIPRF